MRIARFNLDEPLLANFLVGALPVTALTIPHGPNIFYYSLVLLMLRRTVLHLSPQTPASSDRLLLWALAAVPMGILFSLLTHNTFEWRDLEPVGLLGLAIPVFLYLRQVKLDMRFFCTGSLLGAFGAAVIAIWETIIGGAERANGFTHFIPFGELSILLAFFSLAGFRLNPSPLWRILTLVGFGAGMIATILSGTRGAWIAAPVLLLLYFIFSHEHKRRVLAASSMSVAAAVILALTLSPVNERLELAIDEYDQYQSSETFIWSSIGVRLELWRGAGMLVRERPVVGHGFSSFPSEYRRLHEEGKLRFEGEGRHAHNQYFHTLAEEGLIGLSLLVFFLGVVALRFSTAAKKNSNSAYGRLAGLMLVGGYATFGLTQVFLAHNITVIFLAACTAIFLASVTQIAGDGT